MYATLYENRLMNSDVILDTLQIHLTDRQVRNDGVKRINITLCSFKNTLIASDIRLFLNRLPTSTIVLTVCNVLSPHNLLCVEIFSTVSTKLQTKDDKDSWYFSASFYVLT